MDPLTHTATGLFLSRAGLNRWTPQAAPILMLAANAPDIDIVTVSGGSLNYLHFHRHLTHSLAAMPVMAIMTVLLVRLVSRKPVAWGGAFWAALIAVASHLLLDFTNVYGIRLLLPFSAEWLRLDLTGIFDFWIWSAFLLALVIPFLARLVNSEITSGKSRRPLHYGRGAAWFALFFVLLYDGGRAVLHSRAVAILESRLYQGETAARVLAVPGLNPLQWRGVVETTQFYLVSDVDSTADFHPERGIVFYKAAPDPALDAARRTATFQTFLQFNQFPLWRVSPAGQPDDAKRVDLFDLRFGSPNQAGFKASALVDPRGDVLSTSFQFGRPPGR
ncbi:MAG TPA: metal-dependent hydrolase [Bryobacteraceae bacterium]|nr:metal-dependent hydrolase [Bryobacteraceae bacterium]